MKDPNLQTLTDILNYTLVRKVSRTIHVSKMKEMCLQDWSTSYLLSPSVLVPYKFNYSCSGFFMTNYTLLIPLLLLMIAIVMFASVQKGNYHYI